MGVNPKWLPSLLIYDSSNEIKDIVRNLKKTEIKDEDKILDTGIKEYASVPRLDEKAFRYVVKEGTMFLRESVYSMGGMVADSVMTPLGEFTLGMDELNPDLTKISQIKDAKVKQRKRQQEENERVAGAALKRVKTEVQNEEVVGQWQNDINDAKRFVRLGKEDYNQSQMELLAKYSFKDEAIAGIVEEYNTKLDAKNKKWATTKLKVGKVADASERVSSTPRKDIGKVDPKRRVEFEKYYSARSPHMTPYMEHDEEVMTDLPIPPTIIFEKQPVSIEFEAEQERLVNRKAPGKLQIETVKRSFGMKKEEQEQQIAEEQKIQEQQQKRNIEEAQRV